jgi:hypothetical protein
MQVPEVGVTERDPLEDVELTEAERNQQDRDARIAQVIAETRARLRGEL